MLCFIDNMAVLSGLTVGTGRVADLGTILHATALHLVNLNCQAWWEHVDSAANPADGGSRVGVCCEIAKLLGTELREYEFPAWPSDVINAKPEVWLRLLEETEGRTSRAEFNGRPTVGILAGVAAALGYSSG